MGQRVAWLWTGDTSHVTGGERWIGLETRLLVAFIAVAETGSFAEAARRLGYTQSGISQQIAALERIVGGKLLVRHVGGRRPVEPTESGAAFLEHSYKIVGQIEGAFAELVAAESAPTNLVRVAAVPNAPGWLAGALLREIRGKTRLLVDLQEARGLPELFAKLDSGEAELAVASLPVPSRFHADLLGADAYVAVVPSASPLARGGVLSTAALVELPLVGLQLAHDELVASQLANAGVDPACIKRYEDSRFVQSVVAAGQAVAIVPALEVNREDGTIAVLDLPPQLQIPPRSIAVVRHKERLLTSPARELRDWFRSSGRVAAAALIEPAIYGWQPAEVG
jgi:DNA-binding transcriptional LysR family regulator